MNPRDDEKKKPKNKRAASGRKKRQCARYRAECRGEKAMARRLVRHLKRQPQDRRALDRLDTLFSDNAIALSTIRRKTEAIVDAARHRVSG